MQWNKMLVPMITLNSISLCSHLKIFQFIQKMKMLEDESLIQGRVVCPEYDIEIKKIW